MARLHAETNTEATNDDDNAALFLADESAIPPYTAATE